MNILGLVIGHDATAAIVSDGKIIAAINEERLSRIKKHIGFPYKAIEKTLEICGLTGKDIDVVTIASIDSQYFSKHLAKFLFDKTTLSTAERLLSTIHRKLDKKSAGKYFRERLAKELELLGISAPIHYMDHHLSHATAAYYTSGFKDPLIFTLDGAGDDLCSSINIVENGYVKRISSSYYMNSPGYFYSRVTAHLGFKPLRHEGKITGLAAYGNPKKYYGQMSELLGLSPDGRQFHSPRFMGVEKNRAKYMLKVLKGVLSGDLSDLSWRGKGMDEMMVEALSGCELRDDVAAAAQKRLEDVVVGLVKNHVIDTGKKKIAMAGGVFANVKMNQRIAEVEGVAEVFIHPAMGDEGIAAGSALLHYQNHLEKNGKVLKPKKLTNMFLGPEYSESEIKKALEKRGYKPKKVKDIEKYIASAIDSGKIIGWFNGKMEFGPRALGNRSILADPRDASLNDKLNDRLKRTEFMPFAPSALAEAAPKLYKNSGYGLYTAEFMTITFDVYKEWAEKAPAVVHIDNTARPQLVTKKNNPTYYKIIKEFEKLTGLPLIINTSFNMHEEPIVCTPDDAIRSFEVDCVDILALGSYVVESHEPKGEYEIREESSEVQALESDLGVY